MPRKPKRPCAYPNCPKLTDDLYCEEHRKITNRQYEKYGRKYKRSERYGSAWQKIRTRYVKLHPFCEMCFEEGHIGHADIVHHIKPLAEGGTNDESNLICPSVSTTMNRYTGNGATGNVLSQVSINMIKTLQHKFP